MPQGAPVSLLNPLLNIFRVSFEQGGARLLPDALWLVSILFSIELLLSGMFFAMRREVDWSSLVQKTILASILIWALRDFPTVTNAIARGFMSAGAKTSGGIVPLEDLFNPDAIINLGFQVSAMLLGSVRDASVLSPKAMAMAMLEGLVGIVIVITYFLAALALFVTLLEYYLGAAFTTILLPWAMLSKTSWLAERAVSHMFAGGVRMGVIAVVLGVAVPALLRSNLDPNTLPATLAGGVLQLLVSITLCFLMYVSYRIAWAITSGSPGLAIVDMVQSGHSTQRTMQTLTHSMDRLVYTLGRLDPSHDSRQPSPSRRRP
jgi:type IV secretion system protein TrbL